jgi:thiamine biosynthesis lipoprotein
MRMPVRARATRVGLVLVLLVSLAACSKDAPVARGSIAAFGTTVEITLIGVERRRANEVTRILARDLQTLETALDAWHASPLARMNALFKAGPTPFPAAPSVLPLLRLSQARSIASGGLFNPAIGELVRAWGYRGRPADCPEPPDQGTVEALLEARPSMDDITIDGFRVASSNPAVRLDFRDILHGYAVDQAIARLQDLGIDNASVGIGGSVRAIGSRGGYPWKVPVRGPAGGGVVTTLSILGNEAAVTASIYRRNSAGQRETCHDVLDPRTGHPARGTASVTVLHPDASTADAATTALFVAGPRDWHRVARSMGIRYVMLTDDRGRIHMNPAMRSRVKLERVDREVIISEPLT